MSRISGSGVSMPDLIILAAEICQIKLKTRRNQWKFARIDVFGRVGFHGFSTSELETDPPASGFGNRDPWPTRGAVGSGERRSGTGGLGGLGGWAGGLDSPNAIELIEVTFVNLPQKFLFRKVYFIYFSNFTHKIKIYICSHLFRWKTFFGGAKA